MFGSKLHVHKLLNEMKSKVLEDLDIAVSIYVFWFPVKLLICDM